jgi:predicted MFS family arabinose efflux permease
MSAIITAFVFPSFFPKEICLSQPNETPSSMRTVWILAVSRVFVNTIRRFAYPFLPEISSALNVSLTSVQNAQAFQSGAGLIGPAFSPFSERYGRKRVMLSALGLICSACAVGTVLPGYIAVFYLVMVLTGLGKWIFDPAMQAYISDRVPYHRRGFAIGVTELAWAGSLLVAAPLTGILLGSDTLTPVFGMLLGFNLLALLMVWLFVPADHVTGEGPKIGWRESWRILRRSPIALTVLGFTLLMYVSNEMVLIVYSDWLKKTFDLVAEERGFLMILVAIAEVSGEIFVAGFSDRLGKRRLVLVGVLLSSVGYGILPLLGFSLTAFIALLFVLFVVLEVSIVASISMFTEVLPHARAVMMSGNGAAQSGGRFIGAFVGGALYQASGFGLVGGVALVLGLLAFALMQRYIQEAN